MATTPGGSEWDIIDRHWWQVTLCDPIWHVSSRSGVATLRTAIHLLLTYLHMLILSEIASSSFEVEGAKVQMHSCVF